MHDCGRGVAALHATLAAVRRGGTFGSACCRTPEGRLFCGSMEEHESAATSSSPLRIRIRRARYFNPLLFCLVGASEICYPPLKVFDKGIVAVVLPRDSLKSPTIKSMEEYKPGDWGQLPEESSDLDQARESQEFLKRPRDQKQQRRRTVLHCLRLLFEIFLVGLLGALLAAGWVHVPGTGHGRREYGPRSKSMMISTKTTCVGWKS
jgi:hypothetical protein